MSETDGQQIAYGDALDETPTWISLERDLGLRVSSWRINRGRVDETQRTGTGTATIQVHDLAGYLGSGAEFPVHAQLSLRGSPRFRGHVEELAVEVEHAGVSGVTHCSIECVDLFEHLSGVELVPGEHGDTPALGEEQYVVYDKAQVDDRMIQVLDEAGVPAGLQNVFSGNVELQKTKYSSGTTAMQVLDECADAEWPGVSNRFISSTGEYAFRGRFARFDPTNPTYGIQFWEATTGADPSQAKIRRLQYTTQKALITNSAMATVEGQAEADKPLVLIEDAASITKWGRRSWSADNLLTRRHLSNGNSGANEAVLFATYQTANYADPVPRITRVQFRTLRDSDPRAAATWDLMQGVEIGDVIDITSDWISGRYFVEGLSMEVRELDGTIPDCTCELDLSPAAFWDVDPF